MLMCFLGSLIKGVQGLGFRGFGFGFKGVCRVSGSGDFGLRVAMLFAYDLKGIGSRVSLMLWGHNLL